MEPQPRAVQASRRWRRLLPLITFLALAVGLFFTCRLAWQAFWTRNPLDVGTPLPERVTLHNATDTRIRVWENVQGSSAPIVELDSGQSRTVDWVFWDDPSYRAADSSGRTIYCGPAAPATQTHFGAERSQASAVEITMMASIATVRQGDSLLCYPPGVPPG